MVHVDKDIAQTCLSSVHLVRLFTSKCRGLTRYLDFDVTRAVYASIMRCVGRYGIVFLVSLDETVLRAKL